MSKKPRIAFEIPRYDEAGLYDKHIGPVDDGEWLSYDVTEALLLRLLNGWSITCCGNCAFYQTRHGCFTEINEVCDEWGGNLNLRCCGSCKHFRYSYGKTVSLHCDRSDGDAGWMQWLGVVSSHHCVNWSPRKF